MSAPRSRTGRRPAGIKQIPKLDPSLEQPDESTADPTAAPNGSATDRAAVLDADRREAMVRTAAYFRAESRGFYPGREVEDWLAAETEIDRRLANA
jgi:hypothetical protein